MSAISSAQQSRSRSRAAALLSVDLDNDGRIDIVVENIDGAPMILHNGGSDTNNWISLQLVGTRSNRLAIGSKVKALAGSLVQIDEVRSGGSYLSQSDTRIHFGLGNEKKVDRIEIRWPSGGTETLAKPVSGSGLYVIKEGEGIVPSEKSAPHRKRNPHQRHRQVDNVPGRNDGAAVFHDTTPCRIEGGYILTRSLVRAKPEFLGRSRRMNLKNRETPMPYDRSGTFVVCLGFCTANPTTSRVHHPHHTRVVLVDAIVTDALTRSAA